MLVNDVRLAPDPTGALWWPEERALVLADLHLEKGSSLARRGQGLLPPYDTRATLNNVERLLSRFRPARVICLGDSFHDRDAHGRLSLDDRARLARMIATTRWHWILGNHDPAPPGELGGDCGESLTIGRLVFRHEPSGEAGEVAGHLHPKAAVRVRGRRISGRCFLTDGVRLVMPAFGAYAGGLCALDPAFRAIFRRGFQAWIMGDKNVVPVSAARLEPFANAALTSPSDRAHPGANRQAD